MISGDGKSTILQAQNNISHLIYILNTYPILGVFENFAIRGDRGTNPDIKGIHFELTSGTCGWATLRQLYIYDSKYGIYTHGISWSIPVAHLRITDCVFSNNVNHNYIHLYMYATVETIVDGNQFEDADYDSIQMIHNCRRIVIEGNHFDDSGNYHIYFDDYCLYDTVVGNFFKDPGVSCIYFRDNDNRFIFIEANIFQSCPHWAIELRDHDNYVLG